MPRIITYLLTYGVQTFLSSRQLCSPSRTPQHFMEPEGSIPSSREPSTGPYPEPYQSNPLYPMWQYCKLKALIINAIKSELNVFTNCIFSLHNIFCGIFTTCFDPMWSSSGINSLYNHLDIGFYFPYTGQCLHVGKMLAYMYALLSKFVLYNKIDIYRK
jgi:hypothetical protein